MKNVMLYMYCMNIYIKVKIVIIVQNNKMFVCDRTRFVVLEQVVKSENMKQNIHYFNIQKCKCK